MTGPSRTYVLDTSVLLSDPSALRRFEEHEVVVPHVPLQEAQLYFNSEDKVQTIEIFVDQPDDVDQLREPIEQAAENGEDETDEES